MVNATLTMAFVLSATLGATAGAPRECTPTVAKTAEEATSTGDRSWTDLHTQFVAYAKKIGCDDGAIAEGWSDAVGKLLASRWKELPALAHLAASDPPFLAFVLKHVDASIAQDDLRRIRSNASTSCPANQEDLCREVLRSLDRTAPVAAQPDGGAQAIEASPDCSSTLPLLEAWARKEEVRQGSSSFVECAGHPRVLSVNDGRLLTPDDARRSCATSWCFWVHYEATSGSELRSGMHPVREKGGFFWEHVNRVRFKREPTGSWTLEIDPSITFIDGYQMPVRPSEPQSSPRQ